MRAILDWLRLFSLREAIAARGRMAALVVVIAVSSALLVAVLGVIGSIDHSVKRLADQLSGKAALEITGIGDGGFAEDTLNGLQVLPGVSVAAPFVQTAVTSSAGTTMLLGADARSVRLENSFSDVFASRLGLLTSTRDGVIVGPGMGVGRGDKISVGSGSATVVDVLDGESYRQINGGRYLVSPLRLAQRLAGRGAQIDGIYIVPKAGADIGAMQRAVTEAVGGRALVVEPQARTAQTGMGVDLVRLVAFTAGAFAFVVSGFLIYAAMGMSITARRQHLSTLRAIGARRGPLVVGLLGEVALYGLAGGALGAVAGVFIGRAAIGHLPAAFMQTVTATIEYYLPWWAIPVSLVVAVTASVAAATLAARQVYRVSPVEAMAPVGVSSVDTVPRWMRLTAFGVFVVLTASALFTASSDLGLMADMAISTMFGAILAIGFAVGPWLINLCAAVARVFGSAGTVAASAISRAPQRVWVLIMTVAIAVAATLAMNAGGVNASQSALASFSPLKQTDIWVSTSKPGIFPTGPLLPADLRDQVGQVPGVANVIEGQAGYANVKGNKVMLYGLAAGSNNPMLGAVNEEVRTQVLAGQGVVLSRDLARRLHLRTGDTFTLQTAQGDKDVKVLASVPFFSGLTGVLGIELKNLQQWFNRPGQTALQVSVAGGADPGSVAEGIRRLVPEGVHVYTGQQAVDGFALVLKQAFDLNNVLVVIVVIIAAIALLNMLTLSVLERRTELGVLGAIGASRRYILKTIIIEGVAIGLVGGAMGLLFGFTEQYVADLASSQAWAIDVHFVLVPFSFALAAGALVVCIFGSVPPALRAARGTVVEALSSE